MGCYLCYTPFANNTNGRDNLAFMIDLHVIGEETEEAMDLVNEVRKLGKGLT